MSTFILVVLGAAIGVAVADVVRRRRYVQQLGAAPADDLEAPTSCQWTMA